MQRKTFLAQPLRARVGISYLSSSSVVCRTYEGVNRSWSPPLLLRLLLHSTALWSCTKTNSQNTSRHVASSNAANKELKWCKKEAITRRPTSSCSPHDQTLRLWRLQPRPRWAVHTRCAVTNVGQKSRDTFDCRQCWYQRQLRAQTLFPIDLIPLAQRLPLNRSFSPQAKRCANVKGQEDRNGDAVTDAFLSCCASPLCDAKVLRSIFIQLSADQQCSILLGSLLHETHQHLPLVSQCFEEALNNSSFSPAHWIRVLSCVRVSDPAHPLPVAAILRNVFLCRTCAFESAEAARTFIVQALSVMERQKTPFASIVDCLKACGLQYEACAYAFASSSSFYFPFSTSSTEELDGWGYGPLLHCMCALRKPPMKWFSLVQSTMPPVLQRYSTLVLLHAALRKRGGVLCDEDEVWRLFTRALFSPLEAASALHFLLREGNTFTAKLLLDHCHTAQQVVTLMHHTQGADHRLTFQALEKLLSTRREGRIITHLRLENRERDTILPLFFDTQLSGCEANTRRSEMDEGHEQLFTQTLSPGSVHRGLLHQYLRDTLPHSVLARGERSLAQMLAAVPPSSVEYVASSLPAMHSGALSWWVSLSLKSDNVDGALEVLRVIAARGCLPHMAVLVELLESTQENTENFVRSVSVLQHNFPQVSDAVLRAFVERATTSMLRATQSSNAAAQAVHTLKSLAAMSVSHLSAQCHSDMAAHDSPYTVDLGQELCSSSRRTTKVIPLDIAAIRGLTAAARHLKYQVSVSVVVLSANGTYAGWWGSAFRPLRSLTRLAYFSQDLSLWPWVEKEALAVTSHLSRDELHKAARIVSLGSRDPKTAVAFWNAIKEKMEYDNEKRSTSRKVRRARAKSDECTLTCVYAVCLTQGQRQLAVPFIQNSKSGSPPPPLLAALAALHPVPYDQETTTPASWMCLSNHPNCFISCKPKCTHFWSGAQKRAVRKTPRSLLSHLPLLLQRLVRASGPEMIDFFSIPDSAEGPERKGSPKIERGGE